MRIRKDFIKIGICTLIFSFTTSGINKVGIFAETEDPYSKFQILTEIFKHISTESVDEVDNIEVLNNAIKEMVDMLDPHSTYFSPEKSRQMEDNFQGYEGIGVSFQMIDDVITIMQVVPAGPSSKAGLRRGDRIVKINGENVIGIKPDEAPAKLRGPHGTTVNLMIDRKGLTDHREFTVVRDKVNWNSIDYAFMISEVVGYINITQFTATTGEEFKRALNNLEKQDMKKLLLDLRYNPGGYVETAVEVCDPLLTGGKKVVFTKGRTGNKSAFKEWYSNETENHTFFPLIVMINKYTASAAEIVAGAIQDWDRGLIVGETSFGKGLVQIPFKFRDGSSLFLTIARYYTPSGRLIQRNYKGKSKQDYYTEAQDDSLHNIILEQARKTDSLMFKTVSGRKVYGGGGIMPDVELVNKKVEDINLGKIFPSGGWEITFIDFIDNFALHHPRTKNNFSDFLHNFRLTDNQVSEFRRYAKSKNNDLNEKEFDSAVDHIRFMLKIELASHFWGETERGIVDVKNDEQINSALKYFNQAEHLLTMYIEQNNRN